MPTGKRNHAGSSWFHKSTPNCLQERSSTGRCSMSITRREMCAMLPALLPLAVQLQAFAQDTSLPSGAFSFDKAPIHVANNNAQIRLIMRGKLATGEGVEVHETTLPPGGSPTAATHHHPHSEMWLIREGTIELTVNDNSTGWSRAQLDLCARTKSRASGTSGPRRLCILSWRSDLGRSCRSSFVVAPSACLLMPARHERGCSRPNRTSRLL